MEEILQWLIEIEGLAERVYGKAAIHFSNDTEFAGFLKHLSNEEELHHIIIKRAAELINSRGGFPPLAIDLDTAIQQNIKDHLLLVENRIEANSIGKEEMVEFIVFSEFSEWNDIFLYIINTLKHQHKEFIEVAVEIHHHRKYIERYLESHNEFSAYLKDIKKLPAIWEEKILVVDDDEMIVDLLSALFEDEGVIDRASNGKEALEKTHENYYAAIISDVDMPVMNGIEYYNKASEKYPNIRDRFLFFTGYADEERLSFFKKNNLRYLKKPVPMNEIKNLLIDILSK